MSAIRDTILAIVSTCTEIVGEKDLVIHASEATDAILNALRATGAHLGKGNYYDSVLGEKARTNCTIIILEDES